MPLKKVHLRATLSVMSKWNKVLSHEFEEDDKLALDPEITFTNKTEKVNTLSN